MLFYSGMRCGEMLALTLADFDFKANTINVSKTLYRNHTGAPKTDNSNRAITMPPAIMAEIKEYANMEEIKQIDKIKKYTIIAINDCIYAEEII